MPALTALELQLGAPNVLQYTSSRLPYSALLSSSITRQKINT